MIHTESESQELAAAYATVRTIGLDLDRQVFPRVAGGGVVLPSDATAIHREVGKEKRHVKSERGSSARPRERATGWKGETGGSRSASPAASVIRGSSAAGYEEVKAAVTAAYPMSRMWHEKDGIWLVAHSVLVEGLDREAVFVVAIPFDTHRPARGWGFWSRGQLAFAQWIGPRHTNFPDGSICAFDQRNNVWRVGDSPVLLLDLYSVWAIRHLYLSRFGRWPGSQTARWAFERRMECHEEELCGCGSLDKTYGECCLPADMQRDPLRDAISFQMEVGSWERSPPPELVKFLRTQTLPPPTRRYL